MVRRLKWFVKDSITMENKLFVGNLAFSVSEEALREAFLAVGCVSSAKLVTDRETGRARGFGFVEMETNELATQAIKELNGASLEGRAIAVSIAKPQVARSGGRSFGHSDNKSRGSRW